MVLITVCIVQFMAPFMLTAVGVALPSIGRDIGASAVQLGLLEQLYILSVAMTMLTFGRLGDIVGQRKVFLTGLVVFTVLTLSLGFTRSVVMIMIQRFFQGIGASMMLAGSLALVAAAYPTEVRGIKIGIVSACTYTGLSAGPVIGGYVTDYYGWRSVFLMSAPLSLAAIAMCIAGMGGMRRNASGERMDWSGALVYGVSVGLFMLGAAHAKEIPAGPFMIVFGILGLALFLILESRLESSLLDVSLLSGNRFFTMSCLAAMGNYAATLGVTFLMSLFLQYAKGLSSREAGLVLLCQPLMMVIVSPIAGKLADRFEPAPLATVGMLTTFVGLLLAAMTIGPGAPLWLLGVELILIGAGFGIFITPNSTAIMGSVEPRRFGVASGMVGAMRTLGMAVSMTTVALIFSLLMGDAAIKPSTLPEFLTCMRLGLMAFAVFSCLGIVVSIGRGKRRSGMVEQTSATSPQN
jgi:EmrB/QacA subfamily drug resistance transporter